MYLLISLIWFLSEHDKGSVSVAEEGFVEKMDGEVGDYQPFIPVASNGNWDLSYNCHWRFNKYRYVSVYVTL